MTNQEITVYIMDKLLIENQKPKQFQRKWAMGIYYQPLTGKFLYDDRYVPNDVVQNLIEKKVIVCKGLKMHQGEKMELYTLNK